MDINTKGHLIQNEESLEASRSDEGAKVGIKTLISERVSTSTYLTFTLSLFTLQIIFAMLIDDITLIFGFFAAFSETVFNFILPAIFYIQSCRITKTKPDPLWFGVSVVYLIIGTIIFIAANVANVMKIIS